HAERVGPGPYAEGRRRPQAGAASARVATARLSEHRPGEREVQWESLHGTARRGVAARGDQLYGPHAGAALPRPRLPVQPRHAGAGARDLRPGTRARGAPHLRLHRLSGLELLASLGTWAQ